MKKKGKIEIYVEQKENYKNAPFRIRNGNGFYIVGDSEVSKEEWEAMNPAPELITFNEDNPDKTYVR